MALPAARLMKPPCPNPVRSIPQANWRQSLQHWATRANTGLTRWPCACRGFTDPGCRTPTTLESVLRALLAGQKAEFDAGKDDITRYLYIDDAVTGLLSAGRAATLPEWVYNITAGQGVFVRTITEVLRGLSPGARFSMHADRVASGGPSLIDNRRAADRLEFRPAMDLTVGLDAYLRALHE